MGAESFFVEVLPAGVEAVAEGGPAAIRGASGLLRDDLLLRLGAQELSEDVYSCEGIVRVTFREEKSSEQRRTEVVSIVLEGCFACFPEALDAMFLVASRVPGPARFLHPLGVNMGVGDKQEFTAKMTSVYEGKRRRFEEAFGHKRFLTLPDSAFYREYKKRLGDKG